MERWKKMPGWDHYEVSTEGRVRSLTHKTASGLKTGRVLKTWPQAEGHLRVTLQHAPDRKRVAVHVAVLWAFVGPRPEGAVSRHIDGNPTNNELGNLAWGTADENMQDMIDHGRSARGEKNRNAKIAEADVRDIRADARPTAMIAAEYGLATCTIRQIKRGLRWSHVS